MVLCMSWYVLKVFGALTSLPPRPTQYFYGSGETYIFTFYPEFKVIFYLFV